MKLLLTSSGIKNKSLEKALLNLIGKPFNKAKLIFVPTAANLERADKSWLIDDLFNFKKLGFASIDVIDIAVIPKKSWLSSFEKADILVFGGGDADYLLDWLSKSGLKKLLPKILKKKIYVGISSGSMVTARTVSLNWSRLLYYERTGNLEKRNGLGFVDFGIRPHLGSKFFPKVTIPFLKKLAKKSTGSFYAIDDNSAILVVDGKVSVVSEGEWKKFN